MITCKQQFGWIIKMGYNLIDYLKVTSTIKHRNTGGEIIIYAHRVYSLLLKLEKNSIIFLLSLYHAACLRVLTLLLICVQFISQWETTHRHEQQTKFREFIYKEMLAFDFSNKFMCIISLYIIILKFVQIPCSDVHMNNLA